MNQPTVGFLENPVSKITERLKAATELFFFFFFWQKFFFFFVFFFFAATFFFTSVYDAVVAGKQHFAV